MMKFELSERLIREWCDKVFQFENDFDIFEPRYCSLIKITHIRWGNDNNAVQMTNYIRSRIAVHKDTFGEIEYIRVFQCGKKGGSIEKDTVGELKFKDNTSNFYAVALFNEVFYINGVKCLFKPSNFSNDIRDFGIHVRSQLKNVYSHITRNLYVNTFAKYDFVWCNLCCWFGLPEQVNEHIDKMHYGEEDVAIYDGEGILNKLISTRDGVIKYIEATAYENNDKQITNFGTTTALLSIEGGSPTNESIVDEPNCEIIGTDRQLTTESELYETPAGSVRSLLNNTSGGSANSLYSRNDIGEDVGCRSRGMGRGIKKI